MMLLGIIINETFAELNVGWVACSYLGCVIAIATCTFHFPGWRKIIARHSRALSLKGMPAF